MALSAALGGRLCSASSSFSSLRLLNTSWLHHLQQVRSSSLLSYEEVSAGSPTPEHPTARPSRTLFVLHGLLGCGRNWRTWARRLVEAAAASSPPEGGPWRALLLDLRCHGASTRRPGLHPPNNMLSAAEDVSRLIRHLMGSQAPGAVLGHSMGGKVAMALVQQAAAHALVTRSGLPRNGGQQQPPHHPRPHLLDRRVPPLEAGSAASAAAAAAASDAPAAEWCVPPRQLWVLDSQPGLVTSDQDAGTGISRVLTTVHSVPLPIPDRASLLRHLRERGLSEALATWLASNLVPLQQQNQQQQRPEAAAAPSTAETRGGSGMPSSASWGQPHRPAVALAAAAAGTVPGVGSEAAASTAAGGGGGGGPFTWSFDIQCAGAMYMSYRTTEFWQLLEAPPYGTAVHLVQGARSDRWPEAMQRRLSQAAAAAAASSSAITATTTSSTAPAGGRGSFEHHVLERAGHWLHVDNPEGLLRLVMPRLTGM